MRRLLFALSIVLMSSTVAPAMVISEEAFVCPVDNAPFTQMIPISGFAASIMLDFQQRGAIASPSPMPVCPGSGFVMFKQAFSPDEIQRIKEMVERPAFAAMKSRGNEWLLAVWEMKQLNQDPRQIASMYLAATWAAGMDYDDVANEAYAYVKGLNDPIDYLILGEWERRLGRFDAARERFSSIPQDVTDRFVANGWKPDRLRAYVDQQLGLIAARNPGAAQFTAG